MVKEKSATKELFASLDETTTTFLKVLSSFTEEEINTVPFENSWTAAQVADHVMQSNKSMIRSLNEQGRACTRNVDEGVTKLKEIFLNFDSKLQSPKFILPSRDTYNKEKLIGELCNSIDRINELSSSVDLSEMIEHPVFGEVTKLEILHFIVYHTQRHIHQVKKIFQIVRR